MSAADQSRSFILRRAATITLAICLLSSSTPAAPQTIVSVAKESATSFAFWYHAGGLGKLIQGNGPGNTKAQEKQQDRDAKVARLQIFPGDVTIDLSDNVRFSAVAYDGEGNPVGGVKIKWSEQSSVPDTRVRISEHVEFEAMKPGLFTITAQAGVNTAQATVTVRAGLRRDLNAVPIGTRQVSSRDLPPVTIASAKAKGSEPPAVAGGLRFRFTNADRQGGCRAARRAHAATARVAMAPDPLPQGGGGGWDNSNYYSADDPRNGVGNPPRSLDGGAGSSNFQFAAPVYSAPGRGINISLGAAYSSRLWNKAGTQISYDNDRGWPAPGFNLGFGKVLGMGVNGGGMLVDADGTRHGYTGTITFYSWGTSGVMHTTDGSFIDYTYTTPPVSTTQLIATTTRSREGLPKSIRRG